MKDTLKNIIQSKVSANFVVIASIAILQTIITIILGRILSKEQFGLYSLIFISIVPLFTYLALSGQNIVVIRFFSKDGISFFDWRRYFNKSSFLFTFVIIFLLLIISLFYRFGLFVYIILFFSIVSNTMLYFIASFLRSQENFVVAIILERISPLCFFVFLAVMLFLKNIDFAFIAVLKGLSYLFPFIITLIFFITQTKKGQKPIDKAIYFEGIFLWGIGLTFLAITHLDNFFIAKYINYEAVAIYSILLAFFSLYDFSSEAIWSVHSQKFSAKKTINTKRFLLNIGIIAIFISIFYLAFGRFILHILFTGKYDIATKYFIPFTIIGCLRLLYVYPACYFVGKSDTSQLKAFFKLNILGLVGKIIILLFLIRFFAIWGVLLSGIIAWGYRNIFGYILAAKK